MLTLLLLCHWTLPCCWQDHQDWPAPLPHSHPRCSVLMKHPLRDVSSLQHLWSHHIQACWGRAVSTFTPHGQNMAKSQVLPALLLPAKPARLHHITSATGSRLWRWVPTPGPPWLLGDSTCCRRDSLGWLQPWGKHQRAESHGWLRGDKVGTQTGLELKDNERKPGEESG